MPEWISETLLEMHFHRPLVNFFSRLYGANFLKLFKPSPQKEAWVGFDQGWTRSDLTIEDLYTYLKGAIQTKRRTIPRFYIGYFLQFKRVTKVIRGGRRMPAGYMTPYYRSDLSLKPNKTTRISQHETLIRLYAIRNTTVYYACGMLFDPSEIYGDPNLDKLMLVDIGTAPSGWATNEDHFIAFRTPDDPNPYWCSEPTQGKAQRLEDVIQAEQVFSKLSGEQVIDLISEAIAFIRGRRQPDQPSLFGSEVPDIRYLPECFTILQYESKDTKQQTR